MKVLCCAAALVVFPLQQALAWGSEGHSITAEIAQRFTKDATRHKIRCPPQPCHALIGGELGGRCKIYTGVRIHPVMALRGYTLGP
jgi:hypothetical protein